MQNVFASREQPYICVVFYFILFYIHLFINLFFNKRHKRMFIETQGLWDVVVKEFGITALVEFVLVRQSRSIETYV